MLAQGCGRRWSCAARARTTRRGDDGFSIIELIVSLTIFSLLVGSLVTLIATGLQAARSNKDRSVAAHLASQEMDAIRQESFSSITLGQSSHNVTVNAVRYRVKRETEWVANSATNNSCDSTGSAPRVLRASVSVRWPDMRGAKPVATSTEISPPVGSYDPDNGHIAVRVRDSNASPLGGVPVRVIGAGFDQTQTTLDGSGCAFFGFLAPGTYSVTLGTPGWVDRQSTGVPTQSVGVTATTVTSVAFDYDQAATIALSLRAANGGAPVSTVPITLANTGLLPAGRRTLVGVGVDRTLANLFPFSDGYQLWAGDCADADPEGLNSSGNAYWPGAQRENAIDVTPGATTAATATMHTVEIDFERQFAGVPVTVVAVHAPDSACAGGSTLTLGSFSGMSGTQLVAIPYGTWTIQAVAATPQNRWEQVVVDPNQSGTEHVEVKIR